jgi:dihydroxyacetone kinase-like protein
MTADLVTVHQMERWVRAFADLVATNKAYLTDLDADIGDADHGINMDRGMRAVVDKLATERGRAWSEASGPVANELFKLVGMTLVSNVGGASGPLYGTFFLRLGAACGPVTELPAQELAKALRAGTEGLVERGRPELGDKTMFDALHPALEALDRALAEGQTTAAAFATASQVADRGRDATIPMVARKGRASYLGERSVGHQDPGATSAALLIEAAASAFAAAP